MRGFPSASQNDGVAIMNAEGRQYIPSAEHNIGSADSSVMIASSTGLKKESLMYCGKNLIQMNSRAARVLNFETAMRNVAAMASRRVMFHCKSDRMSSLLVEVRKSA